MEKSGTDVSGSLKNNRFVAVQKDAILNVPPHRSRQHYLLHVSSLLNHIFQRIAMGNAHDSLFDNWSIVKHFRYVVSRRSSQLHPAVVRLLVRFRTDERRQERVMDINDRLRILHDEV